MCSFLQGMDKIMCTFLPSGPVLPPSGPVLPPSGYVWSRPLPSPPVLLPSDIRSVVLGACTLSIEQMVANNGRRTHFKGPVGPYVVGMVMRGVTRNVAHSAAEDA
jgi:hypothetical protein